MIASAGQDEGAAVAIESPAAGIAIGSQCGPLSTGVEQTCSTRSAGASPPTEA